jgi:preprotein translocase subunit SecA
LGRQFRSALHGEKPATVQTVQRGLAVAIIDEVDSVLLDSSTSPLLLSLGPEDARQEVLAHHLAQSVARQLVRDVDFFQDTTSGLVSLTEAGTKKVFGCTFELPRHGLCRPWSIYVEQALKAEHLLRKDVEYVVQAGKVLLVDECTGRIFSERRWRDGLHQAVETKEGLAVNAENRPVARISKQRYFSLYGRLCGMTGTAQESAREFWSIYGLHVVVIPPRRPCRRKTYPARLFGSADAKYVAMVREIQRIHRERQPILVGTRTIESSERVARLLDASGIPYRILNGKQDLTEAAIIAQAGEVGAVTIATNMAGRGTDIHLRPGAADLGGLHVIAAEPNESVRVDRQLVGRAARQGDVGSSQIFISAEDPLIVKFAPALGRLLQGLSGERGELIVDLSQEVTRLQRRVEWTQYLSRRRLLRNDNWLQEVLSKWAGHVPEPH